MGPIHLYCANGRCNANVGCMITMNALTISGLYLPGMIGEYNLQEGCVATCEGCEIVALSPMDAGLDCSSHSECKSGLCKGDGKCAGIAGHVETKDISGSAVFLGTRLTLYAAIFVAAIEVTLI